MQQQRKPKKPDGSLLIAKRIDPSTRKMSWEVRDQDRPQDRPLYFPLEDFESPYAVAFEHIAEHWEHVYSCWSRHQENNTWSFCWNWLFNQPPNNWNNR